MTHRSEPKSIPRRVLVTGSRSWRDLATIEAELRRAWKDVGHGFPVLVSGACPHGADSMAEAVWEAQEMPVERHPADWDTHGKRAGFVRNSEMVNLGADICLAFIRNGSRGASMTADMAEKAGIEVRRFTDE